jgi:hypothetical protein
MKEHYEVVLEELKRKKAEAEAGIQAIENLLLQSSPRAVKPPAARRSYTPTDTEEQSVPQRIMTFLERSPGRAFSIEDIAEGIGGANVRTLMGTLGRLYKQEKIARAGRGRYGAKSNRSARPSDPSRGHSARSATAATRPYTPAGSVNSAGTAPPQ